MTGARPLLVSVLILASVATASAESAWVLWAGGVDDPARAASDVWRPVRGYVGAQECLDAAAERSERRTPEGIYEYHLFFMCLPDTIAPRGPKETAWVLWVGEWYDAGVGQPWSVLQAGAARADCLDAMQRAGEAYKDKMGNVEIGRHARDPWALFVFGQGHSVTLRCLPDTVDPRARKAK